MTIVIQSNTFIEQIKELADAHDSFYSISTTEYILALEGTLRVLDEEPLAKALRNHLNSFLTFADVELSSQSVSTQTPRFASLERIDIGMQEVIIKKQSKNSFKHIHQKKTIEWCMKDSFYFCHINYILRSKNIKDIFTNRTIIRDVEQGLILWHNNQKQIWEWFLPMHVYCGQKTSKQLRTSIMAIEYWFDYNNDPTSMDKEIANVFTEKFDNDDHEILFSLRTLFRIDKVEYADDDETWYVNMTVVDENDKEVQRVTAPWKTSILKENNSLQSTNESLIYVRDLSGNNGAFLSF